MMTSYWRSPWKPAHRSPRSDVTSKEQVDRMVAEAAQQLRGLHNTE